MSVRSRFPFKDGPLVFSFDVFVFLVENTSARTGRLCPVVLGFL